MLPAYSLQYMLYRILESLCSVGVQINILESEHRVSLKLPSNFVPQFFKKWCSQEEMIKFLRWYQIWEVSKNKSYYQDFDFGVLLIIHYCSLSRYFTHCRNHLVSFMSFSLSLCFGFSVLTMLLISVSWMAFLFLGVLSLHLSWPCLSLPLGHVFLLGSFPFLSHCLLIRPFLGIYIITYCHDFALIDKCIDW